MSRIASMGITSMTIDAYFYALIETERALSRLLEAGTEDMREGDSRGESPSKRASVGEEELEG